MNKEQLNQRLLVIEEHIKKTNQDLRQITANLNALEGSKLECEYWLKELENESNSVVVVPRDMGVIIREGENKEIHNPIF